MLARSYLILSPATPHDLAAAVATQRQSIPLVWAFAFAGGELRSAQNEAYFETTVEEALRLLDRAVAAWNYNSYFRDVFAPFGVFRSWIANWTGDTKLYLNLSELLKGSVEPERDLEELRRLPQKVIAALSEIEQKHYTIFFQLLRKLAYPLVTVPATGDRETDIEILSLEMRDTQSPEAEMALQMVGVDRSGEMLRDAEESVRLRREQPGAAATAEGTVPHPVTLFTPSLDEARSLLVEGLGASVEVEGVGRVVLRAGDREILLVRVDERAPERTRRG